MDSDTVAVRDQALDHLQPLGPVWSRAMFGGFGLYCDGYFFGLVARDTLYLKVDDATRPAYLARGLAPFQPAGGAPMNSYFEVPPSVIDDQSMLLEWAAQAVAIARATSSSRRPSKRAKTARAPRSLPGDPSRFPV